MATASARRGKSPLARGGGCGFGLGFGLGISTTGVGSRGGGLGTSTGGGGSIGLGLGLGLTTGGRSEGSVFGVTVFGGAWSVGTCECIATWCTADFDWPTTGPAPDRQSPRSKMRRRQPSPGDCGPDALEAGAAPQAGAAPRRTSGGIERLCAKAAAQRAGAPISRDQQSLSASRTFDLHTLGHDLHLPGTSSRQVGCPWGPDPLFICPYYTVSTVRGRDLRGPEKNGGDVSTEPAGTLPAGPVETAIR